MTPFAKGLIFINFFLSMIFTGWAVGLYTQRVDWAPGKTLGGDLDPLRPGRLDAVKKEIAEYTEANAGRRDLAEKRWQLAWLELDGQKKPNKIEGLDDIRARKKVWYEQVLKAMATGKDAEGNDAKVPVFILVRDANDDFDPEKQDPVKFTVAVDKDTKKPTEVDLKALVFYEDELKRINDQIAAENKKLDDPDPKVGLVAMQKLLLEEIVGINNDKGEKIQRGLQDDRKNQVDYLKKCLDEQKYLAPLVNDSEARLVILKRRNLALKERLEQLEKVAANR